jgi:formylglycine-generating enzyme required for sulfatase activity
MGFDVNKNNVLDENEITKTEYVCNGENGADASLNPFIVHTNPLEVETDVKIDIAISAVFNTEMDGSTINVGTFTVNDASGAVVAGTVSYTGIVAVFQPNQILKMNTKYTVNLLTSIKNASGKTMGYNHNTYFTTGKKTQNDYSSPNIGILKYIPAGSFQRDSVSTNISIISKPFRMSEYEITRSQYWEVMREAPSNTAWISEGVNAPVERVFWYKAVEFCNKLSILENLTPAYTINYIFDYGYVSNATTVTVDANADGYRLPTEMEWMWAAMGATSGSGYISPVYLTGFSKPFAGSNATNAAGNNGTNYLADYAWYYNDRNFWLVGSTGYSRKGNANECFLYDMSGNVPEWCWDRYAASYPSGTLTDYAGPASSDSRVVRGGGTASMSNYTVAGRNQYTSYPSFEVNSHESIGFRVVRN